MSTSMTYLPTTASSITISRPLSSYDTSPSTAKSSIFSFADSILSSSPGTPPLPIGTSRHVERPEQAEAGSEQKRATGRPKIPWTSSRSRKLVRLYLMTNLGVEEIAMILGEEGFKPKKRNVQTQLELLLQPRPNQLRRGSNVAKDRHNLLRDCRALREARKKAQCPTGGPHAQNISSLGNSGALKESKELPMVPPFMLGPSCTWENFDLVSIPKTSAEFSDPFATYFSRFPFETIQCINPNDIHKFDPQIHGRDPIGPGETRLIDMFPTAPSGHGSGPKAQEKPLALLEDGPSIVEWVLPYYRIPDIDTEASLLHQTTQPTPFPSFRQSLEVPRLIIDSCDINPSNLEFTTPVSELALLSDGYSADVNTLSRNSRQNRSQLFTEERSSRSSQWNLSTAKGLRSSYDDVISLMEHHTISGSSAAMSSARTSQMSSEKSSGHLSMQSDLTITASTVKRPHASPAKASPPVVLPGAFHHFCWAQIDRNSLGLCRQDGLLCEHVTQVANQFFTSQFGLQGVIYRRIESRGIIEVDSFGNSILHVAACLCAPIWYLISLIRQKANISAKNKGGETFVHLIRTPIEGDDICALLDELSAHHFDFSQRDDHGQTSIHILTRPWHPQQYLVTVIKKLDSLGWRLPRSRDNLCYSLMEQMKHPVAQASFAGEADEPLFRQALDLQHELPGFGLHQSLDLTCEIPRHISYQSNPEDWARSVTENNRSAHTILGPQRYEQHADLLKTINTAGQMNWFEDSHGRNGLHCLAEVAFYPPVTGCIEDKAQHHKMEEVKVSGIMREGSLDGLLAAGVDPNNYDKEGNTPIMSFIIHTHPTEDDETVTRILKKLVKANADIHRRNRQGETALHLSVKLGRRAATKFLLEHGANVHARNKNGEGVLEIGHRTLKACRKTNSDVTIYAQILLCMCLAQLSGAVTTPTILDEWSLPTAIKRSRRESLAHLSGRNKRVKE